MQDDFNDDLNTPTEADLEKCYGSKYLSAEDIGDKKIRTRIGKITKEPMQQQDGKPARDKIVLYFTTLDKPMVLNATNKNALVEALGKKPADWKDAEIGLFTMATQFGGKATRGLRLKVLSAPKAEPKGAAKTGAKKPVPKPTAAEELPWPEQEGDPGPEYTEAAE